MTDWVIEGSTESGKEKYMQESCVCQGKAYYMRDSEWETEGGQGAKM